MKAFLIIGINVMGRDTGNEYIICSSLEHSITFTARLLLYESRRDTHLGFVIDMTFPEIPFSLMLLGKP